MGCDAPNVGRIIRCGPFKSVEAYMQETGSCGCDGRNSLAMLYYRMKDVTTTSPISDSMKRYSHNPGFCHHQLLMRELKLDKEIVHPSPKHMCCDVGDWTVCVTYAVNNYQMIRETWLFLDNH